MKNGFVAGVFASALVLAVPAGAEAQTDDIGKAGLKVVIGTGPGGSYDTIGRLVARHIGKHLPGAPTVVPQNLPGAGGLLAANNLYNLSAQDGSVIGVLPPEILFNQMFGDKGAQFDAAKFAFVGNPLGSAIVVVVYRGAPVTNWRETREREALMGATGPNGPDAVIINLANGALGSKFRVVTGYSSGHDIQLAMERGEVHGRGAQSWSGWKATTPDWVAEKKIIPLFQVALKPLAELPDTPALVDIVDGEAKDLVRAYTSVVALQRPFVAGPKTPAARVAQLRAAFDATMRDAEFQADAQRAGIELGPIPGEELQRMAADALSLAPGPRAKLEKLIAP